MVPDLRFVGLALALLAGVAGPSIAQPSTSDISDTGTGRKVAPTSDKLPLPGNSSGGGARLAPMVTGAQVYQQICQACHMVDAKGGSGAGTIPALAANPKLGVAAYPITVVVRGKGAMPSFAPLLDKKQIADVVTYVRTNFGNAYPKPVTEADVAKLWVDPPRADH